MRRAVGLLVTSLVLVAASFPATAAPSVRPKDDPFYRYSGATPLAQVAPGTVLKHRDVTLAADLNEIPLPAVQLLYRTADEQGRPSATVTTVVVPPGATVVPRIVGYLSFYDSLSDKCDPSYTLTGGDPGSANTELTDAEQALVAEYYASGYITTVPDFEGPGLHWAAGHEAGYGTLDALRATENYLELPRSTPAALSGYSGGSIAGDWAAELAPTYAPDVHLVGVAMAGIPVDFAHNLTYIEGSADWSGIMPAVLVALSRAFGIDLAPYLSPLGQQLTTKVQDQCIGDFSGTTPGLTSDQLLKPQFRPLLRQPEFAKVVNALLMGSAPGHPTAPLLMEVGNDPNNSGAGPNDQAQGDDIMVTKDVEALAHQYCGQGVPVEYHEIPNTTHTQAALVFEPQASAFIAARFAGVPFVSNCSSVGAGNDISPLAVSAPTPTTAPTAKPVAAAGNGLPATGIPSALGLAGLVLIATSALALRRIDGMFFTPARREKE